MGKWSKLPDEGMDIISTSLGSLSGGSIG